MLGDRALLHRARLRPPLLLKLAQLLQESDVCAGSWYPPRSREALLARLRERLGPAAGWNGSVATHRPRRVAE